MNESKTKAILINGKRLPSKINYERALTINGTKLELVPSVKLLSLEIDSELSFKTRGESMYKPAPANWNVKKDTILPGYETKIIVL